MNLIANRQLTGEYGTVIAGQQFIVRDEIAMQLLKDGVVRRAEAPRIAYSTKVIRPQETPEVSPRGPFHGDVSVPDAEPADVVTAGHQVLSESDVSTSRITDSGGRSGRSRSFTR